MTDAEFLAAFEACTLPRTEWTHAAHLRMAYLYLRDCQPLTAETTAETVLPQVRERINQYNFSQGNPGGYHETITAAFLHLVAARLRENPSPNFESFQETHADLFAPRMAALLTYYTTGMLRSPGARALFVAPDVAPLP